MSEKPSTGQTMTRRDRCTRIITTLSRAGRDREIHKALETVLALRGLSALTDAALEDLTTQVVASERAPRFDQNRFAAKREQGCVIFLGLFRSYLLQSVTRCGTLEGSWR